MASNSPNAQIHAQAIIQYDGGGAPVFVWQDGGFDATIVDDGTGQLTVTLVQGLDDTEMTAQITGYGATPLGGASWVGIGGGPSNDADFDKQINLVNAAGAAADLSFCLTVFKNLRG